MTNIYFVAKSGHFLKYTEIGVNCAIDAQCWVQNIYLSHFIIHHNVCLPLIFTPRGNLVSNQPEHACFWTDRKLVEDINKMHPVVNIH